MKKEKYVLFVLFTPRYSGAEIAILNLISSAKLNKFRILCHDKFKIPLEFQDKSIECNCISRLDRSEKSNITNSIKILRQLVVINYKVIDLLFNKKFDLIYINNTQLSIYLIPLALLKLFKRNLEIYWHDHNLEFKWVFMSRYLEKTLNFLFDKTIVPFKEMEKKYLNHKVSYIPNIIDTKLYHYDFEKSLYLRKIYNISSDSIVVGIFGSISERKGHNRLLKIYNDIILTKPKIVLVIIGRIEFSSNVEMEIFKEYLKKIPKENLIYLEWKENIIDYYNMIDIYINYSLFEFGGEALPLTVLEAMSFERLVVAGNNGGIMEVITHNENGLLFEAGNSMEFKKCMIEAIDQYQKYTNVRKNSRQTILNRYSYLSSKQKFYNLINQ